MFTFLKHPLAMIYLYVFCLLFSTFNIFGQHYTSAQLGYESSNFFTDFSDQNLDRIKETNNSIPSVVTSLEYGYMQQNIFCMQTSVFYARALSNKKTASICIYTEEVHAASTGYNYGVEQTLGYPFRYGPFHCSFLLGMFFEKLVTEKKDISTDSIQKPPKLTLYNTMPLLAISLFYQPWKRKNFFFCLQYAYKLGTTALSTDYQWNNICKKVSCNTFSFMHRVEPTILLRIKEKIYLGATCTYTKQRLDEKKKRERCNFFKRQTVQVKLHAALVF